MKKLSDYTGVEAIELWGELLEPMANIIADPEIAGMFKESVPTLKIVSTVLKTHAKDASDMLLKIDDTPLTAVNAVARLVNVFTEFTENEELKDFFGLAEQEEKTQLESIGSATVNTGDGKN